MQQHKYETAGTIFCQHLYAIYDSKSLEKMFYLTFIHEIHRKNFLR